MEAILRLREVSGKFSLPARQIVCGIVLALLVSIPCFGNLLEEKEAKTEVPAANAKVQEVVATEDTADTMLRTEPEDSPEVLPRAEESISLLVPVPGEEQIAPKIPATVEDPMVLEDPVVPEISIIAGDPVVPEVPKIPAVPEDSAVSEVPVIPVIPEDPALPQGPALPENPEIADDPTAPGEPEKPAVPDMIEMNGFLLNERGYITGYSDAATVTEGRILVLPVDAGCIGVEAGAFAGIEDLVDEVYIPANITDIADGLLDVFGCLMYIEAQEGNPSYYSENGILYRSDGTIAACPGGWGWTQ